jgi:hypothetical protein
MSPEAQQFLNLATKPARLTSENVAWLLGFMAHDIPVLVAKGLLKTIGDPPPNGIKYFATADIEQLKTDRKWLARATSCIHRHWQDKNRRKTGGVYGASKRQPTEVFSDS